MQPTKPLPDLLRPTTIDDIVGQAHLFGENGVIRRMLAKGTVPNMIFYGPPGTGKTTSASIVAASAGKELYKLNATSASLADVREVIANTSRLTGENGTLLYLDEIQYFNKKQQQSLLEFIEDGRITLIASTTENPYFSVYGAILSRCMIFEFKSVSAADIVPAIRRGFVKFNELMGGECSIDDDALEEIASISAGDVRRALNLLEGGFYANADGRITKELIREISPAAGMRYDRGGDEHYDLLSALHKSIRGSDENAAIHYLARLIAGGDIISPARRLLCIASEDIGLAYPSAAMIVKSLVDSALTLGLPEAGLPLAQAAILLATSPKSNSAASALWAAMGDIKDGGRDMDTPRHIKNVHADTTDSAKAQGYKYPHDYEGNYVEQQYLPDALRGRVYYKAGANKTEQAAAEYWRKVKGNK